MRNNITIFHYGQALTDYTRRATKNKVIIYALCIYTTADIVTEKKKQRNYECTKRFFSRFISYGQVCIYVCKDNSSVLGVKPVVHIC